jgi:Periplasmic binding protein
VFSPIGTKDFSTYITKIRQSGADACYVTMAGDDYNAFLSQAAQYRLPEKVQLLSEVVDLTVPRGRRCGSGADQFDALLLPPRQAEEQELRRDVGEGIRYPAR